jgi:hypothetical protein
MKGSTPQLLSAEYKGAYRIWLQFADNTSGEIDLEGELWGEVFEPLKDTARFREFRLDRQHNTLVWPTGADLAPEFLYERTACASTS